MEIDCPRCFQRGFRIVPLLNAWICRHCGFGFSLSLPKIWGDS